MSLPSFDVHQIPFSMRGSWLNLSPVTGLHQHASDIHLVSHRTGMHALLRLRPLLGTQPVETRWVADPSRLAWVLADGDGIVEAAFDGPGVLRLRGSGLGLELADASDRLTPFSGDYFYVDPVDGAAVSTSYETGRRARVLSLEGSFRVEGAEALDEASRRIVVDGPTWEIAVVETTAGAVPFVAERTFDEVVARAGEAFTAYVDAIAPWRDERVPAAALAAYVLWSATVDPEGFVTRESVLMSKHWMDKVWSWDHCFNALALAPGLPEAAVDQFLAPFDHQDATGALPDSLTHSELLYNYVKPPIHGWALRRLRSGPAAATVDKHLDEIFDRLSAWTAFWVDRRRAPGHALAFYQHGNDSGWDNSTMFDLDRVIEGPDLAAFLVLQLDVLVALGEELDRPVARWSVLRDEVRAALLDELWTADGFIGKGAHNGRVSGTSSLISLLPLVLADELPAAVIESMAARVALHLTDHGLATEQPTSSSYESDGYWRGPIWAPSTALLEDGLRRSGFTDLADTVSARFRTLCERSGFAENFDALTGEGLRDRAYTWTASVYLTLGAEHVQRA